jgi:class 3 adenylate cyclase
MPNRVRFCPLCSNDLRSSAWHNDAEAAEDFSASTAISPRDWPDVLARRSAKRRQLTVVFCDLVGSSEYAASLDPEDLADLIGRFHRCVSDTMQSYRGFYTPPMGDGALIFFGFPQAHEDDVENALRASLLTLERVAAITSANGRRLHARIGIATGIVIAGDVADTGTAHRLYAAGEPLNLASRLQQLADPDTVVVADNVRRLVGSLFIYRDLGTCSLKGWKSPIRVAQVLRPAPTVSRFEARVGPQLTPLIGRSVAIQTLNSLWRKACDGTGRVAVITGDMGIGKSRIAAQLLSDTAADTTTRIQWFCSEHQQGIALHPCLQQLERAARIEHKASPELRRAKIKPMMRGASIDDFTLIAALLRVPVDPRSKVLQFSLPRRRERTLRALADMLIRLCQYKPVLAILEDVHWSDPTTSELLELVVREVGSLPLLLIVTARGDYRPDWIDVPWVRTIALEPLHKEQSTELVRSVAGAQVLTDVIVNEIVARCDGVPLFLEEVSRTVLEGKSQSQVVPSSIHASLLARLDRLGAVREVVEAAATIGRDVNADLLRQICRGGDRVLASAMDRLEEAGLIVRDGLPESERFHFKHALIQDVAYTAMLREQRQMLHNRVARALEEQFPQVAVAEPHTLARHYTEAKQPEKAVAWWIKAGTQSLVRAAIVEGMAQLKQGLALCETLPDTLKRWRLELDLQILLGKSVIVIQGHGARNLETHLTRAKLLCAKLNEPPQLLSVLFQEWSQAFWSAEIELARQRADDLATYARRKSDPISGLFACLAGGVARFELGSFGPAHHLLRQGLSLFDSCHQDKYKDHCVADPRILLRTFLAWERMCTGHPYEALEAANVAVSEARAQRHSYSLAIALGSQASIYAFVGASSAGLAVANELQLLSDEHGITYYQATATFFRGWFHSQAGDLELGLRMLQQGSELYHNTGTRLHLPIALRCEADLLRQTGRVAEGLVQIAKGTSGGSRNWSALG